MRWGLALAIWMLTACGAGEAAPVENSADVAGDVAGAVDGTTADQVAMDPGASDALQDTPESQARPTDTHASDGLSMDESAGPDGPPLSDLISHMLLTDPAGEKVYLDASYTGYEAYVFGAEVYGDLLKLWASEDDTKLELLIRLDQHELPGSVTPGPPGDSAWALLMLGEENAYVTQTTSGSIQVEECPEKVGQLLSGHFDGVPMYSMSGLSTSNFKISGSFELVLGSVDGATGCAP